MSGLLVVEQCLNGLQFGVMLFLMAAGLTLVFGIMNLVNLAHGSLYMVGAYLAVAFLKWTGSFAAAVGLALLGTLAVGMLVEVVALRTLYERDHLDQVLATFGLILFFNELVAIVWGRAALFTTVPPALAGFVEIVPGIRYPAYRAVIILVGLAVALLLYVVVSRTRLGMLIRAGASNRTMLAALGVNVRLLYTVVFGFGAALAGLGGIMAGPIYTVLPGMGEEILIQVFVVIVIGGIGSIRGALVGARRRRHGRHPRPRVPQADAEQRPRPLGGRQRRARAGLDADLHPHGRRAVLPPPGPVPGRARLMPSRARALTLVAGLLVLGLVPVVAALTHQPFYLDLFRAHHDLRHRRRQPRSDPRLRRHGELRPRRLPGHRRLRGGHSGLLRHPQRPGAVDAGGRRCRRWRRW